MNKQTLTDAMRLTRSTIDNAIMDLTVNNLAPSSVPFATARYISGVKRMSGFVQVWGENYPNDPLPLEH